MEGCKPGVTAQGEWMTEAAAKRRVTFSDVLANREFRAMYIAQALSVGGDQLARFAVAVLVFNRSQSALLTAVSYAVSYLPWAIGGPLLSGYADRLPRRGVMVVCDLARLLLVLLLALPGLPIAVLFVLVTLIALLEPPFAAARASLLPDVVGEGDTYATAAMLSNTTNQFGVVLGFALAGPIVAVIGVHSAILLDAATFAASAVFVLRRVRHRPAADAGQRTLLLELRQGADYVFRDQYLRWLVVVSWIVMGAGITTESMAYPYAHAHGAGPVAGGLLTAAFPLGMVVSALWLGRGLHHEHAERLMLPMALAFAAVLALTGFNPPCVVAGGIWFVSGLFAAVQIIANRVFVAAVPREMRGRAFGIAAAGISTAQGVGSLLSGAIAQGLTPAIGVADAALPAFAVICVLSLRTFGSSSRASLSKPTERPDQDRTTMTPRAAVSGAAVRVWLFTLTLALIGAALLPLAISRNPIVDIHLHSWWLFLLFVISNAFPLHFVLRRQPWAVHLEAVPLVLGLFFLSPVTLLATRLCAQVLGHGILRPGSALS
jgi:MFS family permease